MHGVIIMNQKWKIILSTCLVIAICFTMASAAIESPFTKSSFDKSSATAFAEAKASDSGNYKPDWASFNRSLTAGRAEPAFNPHPIPTFQVPDWTRGYLPSAQNISFINIIPRDTAIEIALAQFPGGNLGVIGVTYKRINAPSYPLAVNPCWVVEILGVRSDCSAHWKVPGYGIDKTIPLMPCSPYGGQVIIDAVTGEVLYVNGWA
jgi:hypothetical protein